MAEQQQQNNAGKVKVQYYRSSIGYPKSQKAIVSSLGITKLNQIVERVDSPQLRGAVSKVPHLLRIVE